MSQSGYNKTQLALIKALRFLCKPLIKLLIEKGISFPQFRELMKTLYVEVADQHFELNNQKASDSRIFILTGVHRKDIKRIRELNTQQDDSITSTASLSGEIIVRWISQSEFLDENNQPRALTKTSKDNFAGFDQLVSSVSKDVRPKAILDEWLRLNIISLENELITLNQSVFASNKEFNDMAYYLGHNIHDHLASCVSNILQENEPMMERSVYYSSLTADSVNKLRSIASQKGNELLQELNSQAIEFYDADKLKDDANQRMRLGVYWYQTELQENRESE